MKDPHWDKLINSHFEDCLSEPEKEELEALLLESAAARKRFWELAEVHGLLREASHLKWGHSPETVITSIHRPVWKRREVWLAAAAVLAITGFLSLLLFQNPTVSSEYPEVVTISEISGTAQWLGENGRSRVLSRVGQGIPRGTITLSAETEVLEFRFDDGTQLVLRGPAELVIEDDLQKRLHLRSGALTADVAPQPEGKPMILRTPTSENVVLGTRFELSADPGRTAIAVDHGKVRHRRLADGETTDVTAGQLVVSDRLGRTPLEHRKRPVPRSFWGHTFETPPPGKWKGDWLEPSQELPGRIAAIPVYSKSAKATHFRVVASSGIGWLVRISPETIVRVRYRFVDRPVHLSLFVHTSRKKGGYGGNFEIGLGKRSQPAGPDGWRTFEGRLGDFRATVPNRHPEVPDGGGLEFCYLGTGETDGGLEVAEISFTTP